MLRFRVGGDNLQTRGESRAQPGCRGDHPFDKTRRIASNNLVVGHRSENLGDIGEHTDVLTAYSVESRHRNRER